MALTTGAAMASAACSIKTMAVNTVGDALSAPGPSVYATDDDPELIRAALPFSLKTLESLLQASPNHKGMLLTACSGFTSYANAFVQLDAEAIESTDYEESERLKARARKLYLRGRDYCMRRVELKRPGLRQALATDPATALGDVEIRRRGAATGSARRGARRLPSASISPTWSPTSRWSARSWTRPWPSTRTTPTAPSTRSMITLDGMSPNMGGDAARARKHFERAVELSKGKSASAYVAMAASVSQPAQNRQEFDEMIEKALAVNPDEVPDIRLATLIAQKRAPHPAVARRRAVHRGRCAGAVGAAPGRGPSGAARAGAAGFPLIRRRRDPYDAHFPPVDRGGRGARAPPASPAPRPPSAWPRRRRSARCGTRP